jgi:hypothetical protein
MPERKPLQRAMQDKREGKAPSTQAGEFIREEIDHIRAGKHGARSSRQAIAIGLSKARRAGVDLPAPKASASSEQTRKRAARDYARGHGAPPRRARSARRSAATHTALEREGAEAASHHSLSVQARSAAGRRSASQRSQAARKAARTKSPRGRSAAARQAVRTRNS